jgi:serine/threonine protein kinase
MAVRDDWMLSAGQTVDGRFELLSVVARGPCGIAYYARDHALGGDVAFKMLHPALTRGGVRDINLFLLNRARAMVHQRLVPVIDVLSEGETLCAVSPFVHAPNLRSFVAARRAEMRPVTRPELATLLVELCRALVHVHRIAPHGNLKPENIFVTADGVRVGDPYLLHGRADVPVEHGAFARSDHYVAPEGLCDPRVELCESDVYSLALIVGELLVGAPVRPAVALSEQGPLFSSHLDQVFLQATADDAAARYGTLAAFWDALREVLGFPGLEIEDRAIAGALITPASTIGSEGRVRAPAPSRVVVPAGEDTTVDAEVIEDAESILATVSEEVRRDGPEGPDESPTVRLERPPEFDDDEILAIPPELGAPLAPSDAEPDGFPALEEAEALLAEDLAVTQECPLGAEEDFDFDDEWVVEEIEAEEGDSPPPLPPDSADEDPLDAFLAHMGEEPAPAAGETRTSKEEREGLIVFAPKAGAGVAEAPAAAAVVSVAPAAAASAPEPGGRAASVAAALGSDTPASSRALWTYGVMVVLVAVAIFIVYVWWNEGRRPWGGSMTPERAVAPSQAIVPAPPDGAREGTMAPVDAGAPVLLALSTDEPGADIEMRVSDDAETPGEAPGEGAGDEVAADVAAAAEAADVDSASAAEDAAGDDEEPVEEELEPTETKQITAPPAIRLAALRCPGGMARVRYRVAAALRGTDRATDSGHWAFCIDRYEYPGAGNMPRTGVNWFEAQEMCRRQGKRLCTNREWTQACGAGYPYGREYDPEACNTLGVDGRKRPVRPTGAFRRCVSRAGVYDLVGNVAEWTADKSVAGGSSEFDGERARCNHRARRFESSGSPHVGFRCCAEPEVR